MILLQALNTGTIRAMGYQKFASYWEVITLWLIMAPLVYIFGFPLGYGFAGLWFGVPFGSFCMVFGYIYIIITAPWEKLALEASTHRSEVEEQELAVNAHSSMVSNDF